MSVFVDTSALLALMDAGDESHARALKAWDRLAAEAPTLVTSNYVAVETFALLQSRIGLDAARALQQDALPAFQVVWIDAEIHAAAVTTVLAIGRRSVSLVDCSSLEVMRRRGILRAFHFDRHFRQEGFRSV
jgi:predicted nucleic acid-binding protein